MHKNNAAPEVSPAPLENSSPHPDMRVTSGGEVEILAITAPRTSETITRDVNSRMHYVRR
jgi:hypothetical protein